METKKFNIINGAYNPKEAQEILLDIHHKNINFNKIKNFSSQVKYGENDPLALNQIEILEQEFESGLQALQSLKKIGANYSNKKNKILNKNQLIQFNNFCLKNFRTTNKKVRLSWFVSYFIFVK